MPLIARIPFAFARSSLFAVSMQLVPASLTELRKISAAKDYPISLRQAGPNLTQAHASAWQVITTLAHKSPRDEVRLIDALRAVGVASIQTHAKRRLLCLLDDLASSSVEVRTRRQNYTGPLLEFSKLPRGLVSLSWPPGMRELLEDEAVCLPLDGRAALGAYPLATWLHDYIATHRRVYEIELSTLRDLCGSTLTAHHFKPRLVAALDRVKASAPFFTRYEIAQGVLTLHKQPTRVLLLDQQAKASKSAQAGQLDAAQRAARARATVCL
ncbi:hypothetical protein [Pseudoxanthomonas mexicana]